MLAEVTFRLALTGAANRRTYRRLPVKEKSRPVEDAVPGVREAAGGDNLRRAADLTKILRLCLYTVAMLSARGTCTSAEVGLLVPGGTVRLLEAVGIRVPVDRDRSLLVLVRALHDRRATSPDEGSVAAVQKHLAAAITVKGDGDHVPALLPHVLWEQAVFGEKVDAERLAARILVDREAALLYYGLFSLDDETLAFFVDHPSLVSAVYEHDAGAFAAFADVVSVQDGRVVLPGVTSWADRWEVAVGAPAGDPEVFIERLLHRDRGRLAWLFDTVARLSTSQQAFVMGRNRFSLLSFYSSFAAFDDGWSASDTPFSHFADLDASMILKRIAAARDGEMAPPDGLTFWEAVFDDRRSFTGPVSGGSVPPGLGRVTAPWLIDRLKDTPVKLRRAHLDAVLFAQRLSTVAERERVPTDPSSLVETLSAFPEYQALIVTLERMGFTDSREYARAVRAARALTARFDPSQQSLRLAMFQGSIALVARMHAVGTLGAETARTLCLSLFPLAASDETRFPEAMVKWLESNLLAALPRAAADDRSSAESRLTDALAGMSTPRSVAVVSWEGRQYRVDVAAAERARLGRILRKLGAADLDSALELGRTISGITAPSLSPADLKAQAVRLEDIGRRTIPAGSVTLFGVDVSPQRDTMLARALELARGGSTPTARGLGPVLAKGLAIVLADVLAAHVYAAAIGDPDASLLLGESPARRHDFALQAAPPGGAWAVTTVQPVPAGSATGGSLLALERALARYRLRPTALVPPAVRPLLWENESQGLAESVTALDPLRLTDQGRDVIVAALRRGRDLLAAAAGRPADIDRLAADAGVEGWRRRLMRLAAASDPATVAGYFSLVEVLGLGLAGSAAPDLDGWGPSMRPIDGSLEQRLPLRLHWRAMAGYPGLNLLSTRVADLQLRVAEWLAERQLPAALAPGVMAFAMWDVVMNTQMVDSDDWIPVFRAVQGVSPDRIGDYVAALAADGPLVPATKRGSHP